MLKLHSNLTLRVSGFILALSFLALPVRHVYANTNKLALAHDSKMDDEIEHEPASAADLETYKAAQHAMEKLSVPMFYQAKNPHNRLYIAALDCDWRAASKGPAYSSVVWDFHLQIKDIAPPLSKYIHSDYVRTKCVNQNWFNLSEEDAIKAFDLRVEEMYQKFIEQSDVWLKEDNSASIRLVVLGYSWGAEQAAALTRKVHEGGIRKPEAGAMNRAQGATSIVDAGDEFLVKPGQTPQAVALLEPVGTVLNDLRLPPSVLSGFMIVGKDEHRDLFASVSIIKQGVPDTGRLLGVTVAGSHADVGGGYHRNGLSIRAGNLMVDYLNAFSDIPYLQKSAEPLLPEMNVIHRSENEGVLIER